MGWGRRVGGGKRGEGDEDYAMGKEEGHVRGGAEGRSHLRPCTSGIGGMQTRVG
jgi:hypothetical protein